MKSKIHTSKTTTILSIFICLLFAISAQAQQKNKIDLDKNDYIVYSVKKGKKVKLQEVIADFKKKDVLFFGEEHNDSIGHQLQLWLFTKMFKTFGDKAVISMEMFDRDVQYIMDEYLSGTIKKSYFLKDSRKWGNYSDYEPMVEFAKEKGLPVVCANAPFRYVNAVSKQGLEGLMKLSDWAKKAIAPLPYKLAEGKYADKLNALMGHDPENPDSSPSYIPGQSLWDATMAYSVFQHKEKNKDAKILHLNGRFHTEERFGIIQRLAEFDANITSIVLTLEGNDENYPDIKFDDYKHLGDYIIFTNPKVKKSY